MNYKKVAIVTGGGSGIGFAIAEKFTQEGIFTYVTGRNLEKLQVAAERLGANCRPFQFDMTWLDKIPDFVNQIAKEHGRIDVLVNNAGINFKNGMLELSDEDFQNVILTNLTSVFSLSREVAKVMVENGCGSIINITSMTAFYGIPKVVAYTASKAGLQGMTRAMAVDLSPLGIRVNSIAPGFIETAMTSKAFNGDLRRKQKVLERTPMGKMGTPKDIANAAYFLASDNAEFITGEVIRVDGGNAIGF
ncbi:MAG: SDR family NAD(P)-dependent oxidoreductase [Bacteroidetes bacterium]|nr:MAG: SDR family NAD(P)-dependent oxidoreductase [Bacteroidota bacterium]